MSATWEALVAWEIGASLEVAQQEGDPSCFESSSAVVDAFLEEGDAASELRNFGVKEVVLLFPLAVADDLGVGFPVGQLVGRFCEGVEPGGCPAEELEEPQSHRVGRDV